MSLMTAVLRISDRFYDRQNVDCVDRQARLRSCIVLVSIFYSVLSIAFMKMTELEKHNRIIHPLTRFEFEFAEPPQAPKEEMLDAPPPTSLIDDTKSGGKRSAAPNDSKADIPSPDAKSKTEPPKPTPAVKHLAVLNPAPNAVAAIKQTELPKPDPDASDEHVGAPSQSTPASGLPSTRGNGIDKVADDEGKAGNGKGSQIGDGIGDDPANGVKISRKIEPAPVLKANIAPYRKRLLLTLTQAISFRKKDRHVCVLLEISKTGELLGTEVLDTNDEKTAREAVRMIQSVSFEPLPDWFRGESLLFKVDLSSDGVEIKKG